MSRVFVVVFLIFGTVVGSGFSSGKEIMVFFSRFGVLSYFYILLAGFLFFLLFHFFLSHGQKIIRIMGKFRFLEIVTVFIALIFCSSMFAGISNLLFYFPTWLYYILLSFLVICCVLVTLKGIGGLQKMNLILMPIASLIFLVVLIYCAGQSSSYSFQTNSWAGFLYSPLYVGLNTCMSGIIISSAGKDLNKKQTFYASLFSTLLLLSFLLLGNFVIQNNSESIFSDMPFLTITSENAIVFTLAYIVILVGCFTTLISLCYTLKSSFQKVIKSNVYSTLTAVLLPLCVSALGFSQIVSHLYPIASVLGICILLFLILGEAFFKKV